MNIGIEANTDNKDILERVVGNHAITFAIQDDKEYFLDPTQKRIYRLSEENNNYIYDNKGQHKIKINSLGVLLNSNYIINKLTLRKYKNISHEEEVTMINKTRKICNENKDIFEKFYNENKELYNETTNKVVKLKASNRSR